MSATLALHDLVAAALARRETLVHRLASERTDCWRLFHGIAEGRPGLAIDRYGSLVLVQTFREPLAPGELEAIERTLAERAGFAHSIAWNHRPAWREGFDAFHRPSEAALAEHVATELGVRYAIRARHRGRDPWLFLDLRAGRREIARLAPGRSVLNLFAYTAAAGVCALAHGARSAIDVDFAASSLEVGRAHAALSGVDPERLGLLVSDCIPALRQLAGLAVKGRAASRPYPRLAREEFDLVVLDPPAFAKSPFGAVDVERDPGSLFNPAFRAVASGGVLVATNHVARVDAAEFERVLRRSADKAGRAIGSLALVRPDEDFPSFDGAPPLKIALVELAREA